MQTDFFNSLKFKTLKDQTNLGSDEKNNVQEQLEKIRRDFPQTQFNQYNNDTVEDEEEIEDSEDNAE